MLFDPNNVIRHLSGGLGFGGGGGGALELGGGGDGLPAGDVV